MVWWRGTRRRFRARSEYLLVLGVAACGGQSTSRDTTGAGGDAGTTSTGGTAGAASGTDSGGTAGAASGTDSGGTSGASPACEQLGAVYQAALEVAKVCNPASSPRCDHSYLSSLPCGCPTSANENPELDRLRAAWFDYDCPQPPCPACEAPVSGYCSEIGRCEDTWAPRCDSLIPPSSVCDYGLPCVEDNQCLHADCYLPGSRTDAVCSKRCFTTNDCPTGSVCIEVGGEGSHCFIRCVSDGFCRTINDAPENPLACVQFGVERVCIQESEP